MWLAADGAWPPFLIQVGLEGDGRPDPERWRAALARAAEGWPVTRSRLVGALAGTRWVPDGPPPALREVDAGDWDGRGPAPFTETPLDPWSGPPVELLLLHGRTPRVLARVHHAAMDGRAVWAFLEDVGAALQGLPVRGGALSGPDEAAIAAGGVATPEPPPDAASALGPPQGTDLTTRWVRRSLPPLAGPVLPRVLAALGRAALEGGRLRVSVPVDLRRYAPEARVGANLTGFVRVELDGATTVAEVAGALAAALAHGEERGPVLAAAPLRRWPLWLLRAAARHGAAQAARAGRLPVSATVSNLGRLEPARVGGGGFTPRRAFWIPPSGPGTPLFLLLAGHPEGVELCVGAPRAFADPDRLERLVAALEATLRADPLPSASAPG